MTVVFSLSLWFLAISAPHIVRQKSNNLIVVVDLLLGQLSLRFVSDDVEILLLFFVLPQFYLVQVFQRFQLMIFVDLRNLAVEVNVSTTQGWHRKRLQRLHL